MATQRAGQPPHERGEHGPVRPVQARTWVGATKHGDLAAEDHLPSLLITSAPEKVKVNESFQLKVSEVVPDLVELEVAVPRLSPAVR